MAPPKPAPAPADLPVIPFLTVVRHNGEWACVKLRMQGDKVLERDVIGGGRTHQHAWNAFRVAAAEMFFLKAWE